MTRLFKKQNGQAILEMLLLTVLVLGVWTAITKTLRNQGAFQKVFGDPWVRLVNTMEFGVPSSKPGLAGLHPADPGRHSTRTRR